MKYILKNVTFSALAALFFVASALCMESEEQVTLLPGRAQGLHFLLTEKPDLFNHTMICCVGNVCKDFDFVCKKTAPQRKKFINGFVNFSAAVKISEAWHKYGSAYAWEDKNIADIHARDLTVRYRLECRILECDGKASFRSGKYQQNVELIENFKLPKFNEAGDVYSYYVYPPENTVMELSLLKSEDRYRPCGLQYVSGQQVCRYNLHDCVGFPDLLKAFLNSSSVEEVINEEPWKLFNLEDAIIPDDYYYSSVALPESLQNAIAQRYQEQQQPKEKKAPSFLPTALVEFLATHPEEQ
jgi:hypothetical protein